MSWVVCAKGGMIRTFLVAALEVFGLRELVRSVLVQMCASEHTYAHELDEVVVDPGTMRQEERASRAHLVEEEQLLLLHIDTRQDGCVCKS